jgi:sec-independent protein translocase protein TatA
MFVDRNQKKWQRRGFNRGAIMLGTGEIILILCAILLLFGGKRLPELAKGLGKGMREFRKAVQGIEENDDAGDPPK